LSLKERTVKSSKAELEAVAAATLTEDAATEAREAKKEAARRRKRERELAKDLWYQTTKIVVPTWFGVPDVDEGLRLMKTFTPAGLLALVAVGQAARDAGGKSDAGECQVGMEMRLRPSGFDREEARELAEAGFSELRQHKLIKQAKTPSERPQLTMYLLSKKGQELYNFLEKTAGCAPEANPR
jgi:hypothetical protein